MSQNLLLSYFALGLSFHRNIGFLGYPLIEGHIYTFMTFSFVSTILLCKGVHILTLSKKDNLDTGRYFERISFLKGSMYKLNDENAFPRNFFFES